MAGTGLVSSGAVQAQQVAVRSNMPLKLTRSPLRWSVGLRRATGALAA